MSIRGVSARLAWRYLTAPKSHGAVGAVAAVSVAGVAVATAAIICVLSVFNGFKSLMSANIDTLATDLVVSPREGKVMAGADSLARALEGLPGVDMAVVELADNALVISEGREMPVKVRGVDFSKFGRLTGIDSITMGDTRVGALGEGQGVASIGVAAKMGVQYAGTPLMVLAPRREGRLNMANPMASFAVDTVMVADVYSSQESEYDENTLLCPISTARELFQRDEGEGSAVGIKAAPGADLEKLRRDVERLAGEEALVKDRFQLQEANFKMVAIEKWVTFLLLAFILTIASFNIISTLCMLVIEKEGSFGTLSALGMSKRQIGTTFAWEALMVTAAGGMAGIVLGVALCLVQEHFGLIRLAGDPEALAVTAYPVRLELGDVAASMVPLALIGVATAWIASAFARRRAE